MRHLHLAKTLDKRLKELQRCGKKAEIAAGCYMRIVDSMRKGEEQGEFLSNKRTKNGELRIKNCIKYDLGGGYRLVTIRNYEHLLVVFIGTHDETNQWIENHRDDVFLPGDSNYSHELITANPEKQEEIDPEPQQELPWSEGIDLYEQELMARLDESVLRSIFQGLYARQDEPCQL